MPRPHDLEHGADCWCEPKVIPVLCDDGDTNYVYVHHTEECMTTERCSCE